MDHDYELEDDYAPRILWGRLAFFALALLLAFVVGRACAPNGVPQSQFQAAQEQVTELRSTNEVLQAQVDAAGEAGGGGNNNDDGGNNNGGGGGGGKNNNNAEEESTEAPSEAVGEGQTYTVQSGDTLTTIAEKFYGDATAYDLIVDANNLDGPTGLRVGQELVIPEKP